MASTYNWGDIKNLIEDKMQSSAFVSDNPAQILRAFNVALDRMNAGDTGEQNSLGTAFDFQREVVDITFVTTCVNYEVSSAMTFKFPADHGLRIDDDEDIYFAFVTPEYFRNKAGVFGSSEYMYAVTREKNSHYIMINYTTNDTLTFEYYTTDMVLDDDGSTRSAHIDGVSESDTFLFDDRWVNIPINFAMHELYGQFKGYTDPESQYFLKEARKDLKTMVNSIGVREVQPMRMLKVRSEWKSGMNRISRK